MFDLIKVVKDNDKDNSDKRNKRNNEKDKNRVYKCEREPIYATPRRVSYKLNAPAPLDSHSQQTSTSKIKDFLRKTLSQHNKFCDRRTIVEHIALNV